MAIFLGVDGGGSKTAALLVDESMRELGSGLAGASNHLRVGIADATRNVERAINLALVQAAVPIAAIDYAYCGIAGADHPEHRATVVDALRVFFPRNNFTVDSDARVALTGAVGFGAGIVIVAGTGSVAFGHNAAGDEARAGGWGPTLGDEGSGYAIGRDSLAAVVRAFDGRGPATRMTQILCEHFKECHPEDLPKFVYSPSTHADEIAVFCRMASSAAEQGDPLARGILDDAGRELARSVVAVATSLEMLETAFPVAYVGGVFRAGRFVLEPLRSWLLHHAPEARLEEPLHTPAEGAAMMAIRAAKDPRPGR